MNTMLEMEKQPLTTYREVQEKGTLYRVTSVFEGKFDLKSALEDLTVRRVTRSGVHEGSSEQ